MAEKTKRYAVVTGANKGIGFGACKQLASNGIVVILTARDEKRGRDAVQNLKDSGHSDYVLFHQLDVTDSASIAALADFIRIQFGKLDILVNNAGIIGAEDGYDGGVNPAEEWSEMSIQTYKLAEECVNVNYYGGKRMVEALIPLLQLSESPTIVNVSSMMGMLKYVLQEWAVEVLSDAENLSYERIDEVLRQYLIDFREGLAESKGWPAVLSAYKVSKASLNAFTRILAKEFPRFRINCVCPGYIRTDINFNRGPLAVEVGADNVVRLALLPNHAPSGCFFNQKVQSTF